MRDIGKNIRSLRMQKGMTQEQFAEKLFVTRQTVSNYETGKSRPDIDMVVQIAQVLQTDANTVLYGAPATTNRARDLRVLFISGGVFLVLTVIIALASPVLREWQQTRFWVAPMLLLRITLIPAQRLVCGWTIMHALWMLLEIKPFQRSWCVWVRRALLLLIGVGMLIFIPYILYAGITSAELIWGWDIRWEFPGNDFYSALLLWVWEYPPNVSAFFGALLRIFDIPKQKA